MQQLDSRKAAEAKRMHDKRCNWYRPYPSCYLMTEMLEGSCTGTLSCLLLTAFCHTRLRELHATEVGELKARIEKVRLCTHCYDIHPLYSECMCTDSPSCRGQCNFAGNPSSKEGSIQGSIPSKNTYKKRSTAILAWKIRKLPQRAPRKEASN